MFVGVYKYTLEALFNSSRSMYKKLMMGLVIDFIYIKFDILNNVTLNFLLFFYYY